METIITSIIEHWGVVGILGCAAGYIIYDNYQKNKEVEKELRDIRSNQTAESGLSHITDIIDRLTTIRDNQEEMKTSINGLEDRMDTIEANMCRDYTLDEETDRLNIATQMSNLIHSLIRHSMDSINADHIAVGVLHNGTSSIHGVPFMKYDIISEHFDILENPHDYDLYSRYKGTDIMIHNLLPQALIQQQCLCFDEVSMDKLRTMDNILYNKIVNRGIKCLYIHIILGENNSPIGFMVAYSFGKSIDKDEFKKTASLLQDIYNND